MASIRKSFNLRNGVQVDDDNFIVNSNGLVGIGTLVPTEILDVYGGNIKTNQSVVANQLDAQNISISGISTLNELNIDTTINVGITTISSGIITAITGIVTYYGDGGRLLNLPTSQWLDVDVGLGFTSIYAQGFVGVGTNDPRYLFQVSGNNDLENFESGVGIDYNGNIISTGIITSTKFVGIGSLLTELDASNISYGTLSNSILSDNVFVSGIITAGNYFSGNLIGNLVGIADTANDISSSSSIGISNLNVSGISTVDNFLNVSGYIGLGTDTTNADLHIRRSGISSLRLTSDGSYPSIINIGREFGGNQSSAEIRFGNTDNSYSYSTEESLDIINYDTGNLNYYNNIYGGSGSFNWFEGTSLKMTLSSSGYLGLGTAIPSRTLDIVGTSTVSSHSYVGGDFSVVGNANIIGDLNVGSINSSGSILATSGIGIATNSPTYTLQVGTNPLQLNGGVGMSDDGYLAINKDILLVNNIFSTGILTCTGLYVDGNIDITGDFSITSIDASVTSITNISADNINSGTIVNEILPQNISIGGSLTAAEYYGDGFSITNINADNIQGNISNSILPNPITSDIDCSNITCDTISIQNQLSIGEANISELVSSSALIDRFKIGYGNDFGPTSGYLNPVGISTLYLYFNRNTSQLELVVEDSSVGIVSTKLNLS